MKVIDGGDRFKVGSPPIEEALKRITAVCVDFTAACQAASRLIERHGPMDDDEYQRVSDAGSELAAALRSVPSAVKRTAALMTRVHQVQRRKLEG